MIITSAKLLRTLKIGDEVIVQDNENQVRYHGNVWEIERLFLVIIIKPDGGKKTFMLHHFDSKEYSLFLKV